MRIKNHFHINVFALSLALKQRLEATWTLIGHLPDGVILLLRPESFSFFFSYLNLVIPARFK